MNVPLFAGNRPETLERLYFMDLVVFLLPFLEVVFFFVFQGPIVFYGGFYFFFILFKSDGTDS